MGKKHRQPQPIDILNVPSPATLLGAGGYLGEKPGTGSASSPVSGDRVFPGSPATEDIEDYGDRGESSRSASLLGAENFSSQSDDGNDGSSNDDGGTADSSSRDSSVAASGETSGDENNIRVDFEVNEMAVDDIDAVMHLMDQLVPDHLNEVDRDDLGLQLVNSPYTSLVQVGSGSSARNEEDDGAQTEVYGMVSIVDVATSSAKSLVSLVSLLRTSVWAVAAPGISVADLLLSRISSGRAKAVLLISEHIRNVPLEIVSRTLTFAIDEFEADSRRDSNKPFIPHLGKGGVFAAHPCSFVVLAKIQRTRDTTSERHDAAAGPAKKKSRTESGAAGKTAPFKMEEYTFWREEDETLFELRDKRVAVHVYRCRPQYDTQPEVERPLTISFALSMEGMRRGLELIRRKEELQPVE